MNHKASRTLSQLAVTVFLAISCSLAFAQNINAGAITGTVTDSTGAVLPKASIAVTNQGTKETHVTTSTDRGFYTVENLPGGDYTVTTTLAGFGQSNIANLHLDPGQRRGQDIKLAVGNVDTKVNVEANAIAVQTESSETGGTISAKEVANLMLNGRNFQQLATLVPGVSSVRGSNSQVDAGYLGQTTLIVSGSSVEQTTYTIDGIYNMTPTALINVNITPSIDSIQEMRVLKNNYSAKYGYAGSGQILIQTKTGGTAFHGTGYEFLRSNSLGTARNFFNTTPLSSLHLNIRGFTLGGPVFIPKLYNTDRRKTFFFVGAEWKTNHYASVLNTRSMFTQAIRNGDLSSSFTLPTSKTLACDTYCQSLLSARGLSQANCFSKDSSGNTNQLKPSCFDQASAYFINPANNYYPLPNNLNSGTIYNYINTNPELDSQNDTIYRVDHNINDKHLITVRYMHEEVNDIRPARNYNNPSPNPGAQVYTPALNAMVKWNQTWTSNFINSTSLAYTFQKVVLTPTGQYTIPSGLISQRFNNGDLRVPGVSIGNYWAWLGIGVQPNYSKTGDGILSDDVTWVKGRHVIQAGGFYMWNILRLNASAFSMGNFSFSGAHTGDIAADFLLGLTSSYSQSNVQRGGVYHQRWYEGYLQDDFKVHPRLTLNMGVRYAYFGATTKEGNDVSNFDPTKFDTSQAPAVTVGGSYVSNGGNPPLPVTPTGAVANITSNGIVFACQNGVPCGVTSPRKGLFSPRVGFALRLGDSGKMSLHGGYGFGYTQVGMLQTSGLLSNIPYVQTQGFTNTQFSNPAGGTATLPGLTSLNGIDNTYQPSRVQGFSMTLENEVVPRGIWTIGYAGTLTDHIFSSVVDRNYPISGAGPNSAACAGSPNNINPTTSTNYDFDPCINAGRSDGVYAGANQIPQISTNYYRPYKGYGTINSGVSIGSANYHSLQTGFIYRLSDLQLNLAYTWSKSLGNQNPTGAATGYDSATSFQNPRNPNADYGLPNYDRPHVFVGAFVYELPFFKHSSNFIARQLLSRWGVSGLATAQSGFAATAGLSSSYSGQAGRPNQIGPLIRNSGSGKQKLGQKPLYNYSSFVVPSFGYFGNSHVGILRGPREVTFATAINKTFPITERIGAQLRVEAFNVFNHPNITGINTSFNFAPATNASSFGYASTAGDPRQMEFSARVNF